MSAEQIKAPDYLMGFPLGFFKQSELSEAIREAAKQEATTILGVWCGETGFAVMTEIYEGQPALWHCVGPMRKESAQRWFEGMEKLDRQDPVSLPM